MLSKIEIEKSKSFVKEKNYIKDKLLNYETKYKMNSLEVYYSKKSNKEELNIWKNEFNKFVYNNLNILSINKINKIFFITIPRQFFLNNILSYLDLITIYAYNNKNVIIVLTNTVCNYKKILEFCNERNLLCLLISNDLEDKYLDYSNVLIQVVENPVETAKKLNLKTLNF